MINVNIFSYALADYKISDVQVNIYFAPAVLDAFYSKKDLLTLSRGSKGRQEDLNGIFTIIKSQIEKYNT